MRIASAMLTQRKRGRPRGMVDRRNIAIVEAVDALKAKGRSEYAALQAVAQTVSLSYEGTRSAYETTKEKQAFDDWLASLRDEECIDLLGFNDQDIDWFSLI